MRWGRMNRATPIQTDYSSRLSLGGTGGQLAMPGAMARNLSISAMSQPTTARRQRWRMPPGGASDLIRGRTSWWSSPLRSW